MARKSSSKRKNPSIDSLASGLDRFDNMSDRAESIYRRGRRYSDRGKEASQVTPGQIIGGVAVVALAVGVGWYFSRGT